MKSNLAQELEMLAKMGILESGIPDEVSKNLAQHMTLRPYQVKALECWMYYLDKYPLPKERRLLLHMATGSGKTLLMAAFVIDLYCRGYRNFLFFVNSAQIIEKTKENFLNPASTKYLFAQNLRILGKAVKIRSVDTFDAVNYDAINIHFTTIQGLHRRMIDPKENTITIDDFEKYKVVMISDEAHHLNAETKTKLTKDEAERMVSWEHTVENIFEQNYENMLLEFTATLDLNDEAIRSKYNERVLYDYSLKQFREDGYSKDIKLRQVNLPPPDRMMQAVILSQYRRKVAEAHGVQCKPIVLMKSKKIKDSEENERKFKEMIAELSAKRLKNYMISLESDETLSNAFSYIIDERGIELENFVREIQGDFSSEKVVNVNDLADLARRQIELNSLEDRNNEIRVIFAVNKLNEGWDVLNLFDIVRLYDTRDGKAGGLGRTTVSEAQLIGRGARYFPFADPNQPGEERWMRKYDSVPENSLRILEELHYHCSHNPKYIHDLTNALRETGMWDEDESYKFGLTTNFKRRPIYKKERIWMNDRIKNNRNGVIGLSSYKVENHFSYPMFLVSQTIENSVFGERELILKKRDEDPVVKTFKLVDFGNVILRFAMDANEFFTYSNLKVYFPKLKSALQFIVDKDYLGKITVDVRGIPRRLGNLSVIEKMHITQFVVQQVEKGIKRENVDFIGTKEFKPYPISQLFNDKIIKMKPEVRRRRIDAKQEILGMSLISFDKFEWLPHENYFGTDQELHFIKYISDQFSRLSSIYEEFYLLRNEKSVTLYDFDTGRGFEPDFVLLLRKKEQSTVLQLFIEPKGKHLFEHDSWKQDFLNRIKGEARLEIFFRGKDYTVLGLPFFNEEGQSKRDFNKAFESEVIKKK